MIPIAKPLMGDEERDAVLEVMASGHIASGPRVHAFEEAFAKYVGTGHAVACANGTAALQAAFEALEIGVGDEVVVPAFTFVATANAVLYAGAKPVFVDVDPDTFTMDPSRLERAVSPRTKAIVPVHLYGQAADMSSINTFARANGLKVVGDAAQAHGAEQGGRRVGGLADCETFSFYPTKNMTCGEGGMVTTDDDALAARLRSVINHGRAQSALGTYDHLRRGHNFRMSDLHAAIGLVQLGRLDGFNQQRRDNARAYDKAFAGLRSVHAPKVGLGNVHVYHQYTIVVDERAALLEALKAADIGLGVYYPRPLHQYPHLEAYGHTRLGVSEKLAGKVVSIPVHPALSDEEVARVAEVVQQAGK